jgi:hypothetical protein
MRFKRDKINDKKKKKEFALIHTRKNKKLRLKRIIIAKIIKK